MTFTKEEVQFIYTILDQVNIQGLAQKAMVVQIMAKIAQDPENGDVKERLEKVAE